MRGAGPRERAAALTAVAFVCVAPQMLGGAIPELLLPLVAGALFTLGLVAWTAHGRAPATLLGFAMIIPLAWTLVQGLPLPCPFVETLDPEGVQALRRALTLVDAPPPSKCTLSRDPGATLRELCKGSAIVAAFLAGALLASRGERRTAYLAVGSSCVLMALVAMTHTASDATRIFGVYAPVYVKDAPVVAPLLNPNTLGGFLAPGVPLAVGLSLVSEDRFRRTLWAIASAVLAACVLLAGSRGAIVSLAVGLGALAVFAWRRPARDASSRRIDGERLATAAGIATLIVLAVVVSRSALEAEFRLGGWGKLTLVARAYAFTAEHPWLGVGRGAFASAFPAAQPSPDRFEHAESFVAQWAAEWGWPVSALLLVAIVHALWRRLATRRSLATLGALAALVTVAAHNALDLGLELVGVAVVWAFLLGATATPGRHPNAPRRLRCVQLAWGSVAFGAVALAAVGPSLVRDDAETLTHELRAHFAAREREAFARTLARAAPLHPARPEIAFLAAEEALAHGDVRAGRWINRAMQLAPGWAGPHVQAMRWLWNTGRTGQALVELRLAAERDVHSVRPHLCDLASYDPDGVVQATPTGPSGATFLEVASGCFAADSPGGRRIDDALERRFPKHPWSRLRNAERALAAGDPKRALELSREAFAAAPEQAERALEIEARAHARAGAPEAMRAALERLRGTIGARPDRLAAAMRLEAELEVGLGNLGRALVVHEQSYRITNDTDALWRAAEIAERIGDRRRAARAYDELCELAPERGACARRDALLSPQ